MMKLVTAATTGRSGSYCELVAVGSRYQDLGKWRPVQNPKYTQPHMHMENRRANMKMMTLSTMRSMVLRLDGVSVEFLKILLSCPAVCSGSRRVHVRQFTVCVACNNVPTKHEALCDDAAPHS